MTSKRIIYYLLAAFITGNLLLIFMQYNSARNIDNLISGNEKLLAEFKTGTELRELEKDVISMESDVRGAIAMADVGIAGDLEQQVNDVQADLSLLQQIKDDESSVRFVDELDRLVQEKIVFSRQVLDTFNHAGKRAAEELMTSQQGRRLMDSISIVVHKIDTSRQVLLTRVIESIDDSGRKARSWGTILIIIVLLSGAGLFWYIINRIASQNQLIRQLDASEKKEREAARIKENFLANMSHEIRTPMNAILGFTTLLQKKKLDTESASYIHTIRQSGENLLAIINDILDLSRIEAGMMRIEPTPFSVRSLIHSVETMFHEKTKEKGLLLTTSVESDVPDILEGDAVRLTQILVNLIGNAVKFTQQGSINIAVHAESLPDGLTGLFISVTDTGIGIEKEKLPRIFDRFRQAEDSITRKYGGTGLGLSIVKDLVDLQKGKISVISEPGLGTRFQFSIPYKVPVETTGISAKHQVAGETLLASAGTSVLVVEDNEINQLLMKQLLRSWQIDPVIAANGRLAIEQLRLHQYQLILMDIQMPEMDGYTTAQFIRGDLGLTTPIIAMTAHALAGEREKCLAAGMDEYISKPVRENELQALIGKFIDLNQSDKPAADDANGINNSNQYRYINLSYMKEVSGGDKEYEQIVTAQFLELVPADLERMDTAWREKDFDSLRRLAHSMKTSVSVMGLNPILEKDLDAIEYSKDENEIGKSFSRLVDYCHHAVEEARNFYASLQ
jgi:signal transduction histidine kinase/DNA-binding NarL/FixJ family response regulator